MAALPSPTQISGNNNHIYEALYTLVDPNGLGTIGGMEAARFLKHSGLSDVMLSRIWDLSDPGGRGCLDKTGLFVALKLVALVQNGRDCSIKCISEEVPPPKMGDLKLPKIKPPVAAPPVITSLPPSAVDWTIKPSERENYDKLFDSLQPINGVIPGNKVKDVLMQSKLPFDTLGKIWELADQDKDGMLNRHEFVVAMHLVYKALEKYAIPNMLPKELMPPPKEKPTLVNTAPPKPDLPPPPAIIPLPTIKPVQSVAPTMNWVVTPEEKAKSDTLFTKSDVDMDGFVSGIEIKDVFLRSGVPQSVLAHIWSLCDINQTGKLNNEQFALAMWLIARCLKGIEPPGSLAPDMVPPSLRTTSTNKSEGLLDNNNSTYSNPELDMISKDIEELYKEKMTLETDVAQKEADIKIKTGEIRNLESELNTLATTLKQLETQKGEAQKRLNDLKAQVDKLGIQAKEQAELVASQESELKTKKEQVEGLRMEEQKLEQLKSESLKKLESMTVNLQETQLSISQIKALINQVQEENKRINDALEAILTAEANNNLTQVPDGFLKIKPDTIDEAYSQINENKENKSGFANANTVDPFLDQTKDAFHSDPFANSNDNFGAFDTQFGQNDPFKSSEQAEAKDAFGCDPFAVLHAPTRDGKAAPSPALPPKKTKNPPPRPAPPRPAMPPSAKKSDMFGGDPFEGPKSGFQADFSDFDSKTTGNNNGFDFKDDPFKNYRYEDPFNITFEDDNQNNNKSDSNEKSRSSDVLNNAKFGSNFGDTFDPFGLERPNQSLSLSNLNKNLRSPNSGRVSAPIASSVRHFTEAQQLEWAAKESLKLEEERKRRQLEEDTDLALAISLSRVNK